MSVADEITGPVDLVLIAFPGNQFSGEIAPALRDLVADGQIRILDLVFAIKDADGNFASLELSDVDDASAFDDVDGEIGELLTEEDIESASEALEPNSSALLMLFENTWASRFATAARNAKGEVVAFERIPREVIEEALGDVER